jgi:Ser/Thr protein kinase RdoA (MazF antagonist)
MSGEYAPEVVADLEGMATAGLSRWPISPHSTVRLLNLSENATFALTDAAAGREWILRIHRLGYRAPEEIRSELAWIQALRAETEIATAAPLAGRDGDFVQTLASPSGSAARHAVVFERLPGSEPEVASGRSADAGSIAAATAWFAELGSLTAVLHGHARRWRRPATFRRKRWDLEAMLGPCGYWGPWRASIGLDAAGTAVLERAIAQVRARLAAYGMSEDRFGLVHADLRLANLLVDGPTLRVIDFDDCGFSWFIYDFAAAVSFIEHEAVVPALLEAWLSGYRALAPLPEAARAELPTVVILRRILLCAWLASHAEVPFARQFGAAYTQASITLAERYLEGRFLQDGVRGAAN